MATPSTESAAEPSNRQLAETLFTRSAPATWRCLLCSNAVAQAPRKGYTNLRSHLWLRHRETFLAEFQWRQQQGIATTAVSPPSASYTPSYGAVRADADVLRWLDWIVGENRDPAMCASPETLKHATPGPVTPSELRRCLDVAYGSLMARITDELGSTAVMGLAMDAWSRPLGDKGDSGLATAAVYAVLPPHDETDGARLDLKQQRARTTCPRRSILLGLSVSPFNAPTNKEDSITDALVDLTNHVTDAFGIDVDRRVAFLVGDPDKLEGVQKGLVSDSSSRTIPVISCANKLLRAAADTVVNRYHGGPQTSTDVPAVCTALGEALALPWTVRQRACALSPSLTDVLSTINVSMLVDHAPNWIETLETVTKYQELYAAVTTAITSQEDEADTDNDALKRLLVPVEVFERLQSLCTQLNDLESVKHKLSLRSGAPLHLVRRLFDAVRDRILGCATVIPMNSASGIESGVVKVLQDRERALTVSEERAMALLRLDRGGDDGEEQAASLETEQEELSFADMAILEATGGKTRQTKYMDLWWVPSTAEDRALLFPHVSRGNHALDMSPLTVEMLAMLRYNRNLWSLDAVGSELGVNGDDGGGKKKRKAKAKGSDAVKRRRPDSAGL